MPGVTQCESQTVLAKSSPSKRNRLSLRFFQKKDTKRALDFTETPPTESQKAEGKGSEICDQVVPAAQLSPPACCAKKENIIPFVGFNNLGNTCYLNSILQVLCYCPGFQSGVKHLCDIISKKKETLREDKEPILDKDSVKEDLSSSYEVICSLNSLILSVEHLQVGFLSNPENYDSELAAQPRRLLNTLRELNPMYEGYLQHDAQEVLQCILGNIQEACQAMKMEKVKSLQVDDSNKQVQGMINSKIESNGSHGIEKHAVPCSNDLHNDCSASVTDGNSTNEHGKRKSDTEVGNAKKKTKLTKEQPPEESRLTRSKRKSVLDKQDNITAAPAKSCNENVSSKPSQKKSKLGLNWLKSSNKQPSILSKFYSLSKQTNSSSKVLPTETGTHAMNTGSKKPESEQLRENGHPIVEECTSLGKDSEASEKGPTGAENSVSGV
ncbi:hypothetical protein FKM82_018564 [Ascaphus truei]